METPLKEGPEVVGDSQLEQLIGVHQHMGDFTQRNVVLASLAFPFEIIPAEFDLAHIQQKCGTCLASTLLFSLSVAEMTDEIWHV